MKRSLIGAVLASLLLVGVAGPAAARGPVGPPAGVVPGEQTIVDIVVAAATAEDPDDREFTLLPGATFSVDAGGTISAVGSTADIGPANISASNGVIHVVDAVLLPIDLDL